VGRLENLLLQREKHNGVLARGGGHRPAIVPSERKEGRLELPEGKGLLPRTPRGPHRGAPKEQLRRLKGFQSLPEKKAKKDQRGVSGESSTRAARLEGVTLKEKRNRRGRSRKRTKGGGGGLDDGKRGGKHPQFHNAGGSPAKERKFRYPVSEE